MLSVGMKCIIVGARFKETEYNIGKAVTLLEFIPAGTTSYSKGNLASPSYADCWYVEGDSLVGVFITITGRIFKEENRIFVAQHLLMPLGPLKETEQDKQETLVF